MKTDVEAPGIVASLDELLELIASVAFKKKPQKSRAALIGTHASSIKGRGMEFAEVRHYQAGDDVRHMDWRITARTGKPHVKQFHEERERPVFILTDFNPSMFFGTKRELKSVTGAKIAALLAHYYSSMGDKVGGICFSGSEVNELKPMPGKRGLLPFVHALSHLSVPQESPHSNSSLQVVKQLMRLIRPGCLVYLVSDFYQLDEELQRALQILKLRVDCKACLISDEIERLAPRPSVYPITNGRDEWSIDTSDDNVRQQYQSLYRQRLQGLQDSLGESNVYETTLPVTSLVELMTHHT